ncbi:hypothetical protein ACFSKL_22990 [Belliella marina]|uniref:Lipoprotein n=1 Tax=Belliella marina TaxID=1644146 RepID=A0ABW4VU06_9BACT
MNRLFFPILTLIALWSCTNDIDKNITTNLQVEANEIFRTSLALEESLIYPFYSFEAFQNAPIDTFPGCPDLTVNEILKTVTLDFSKKASCESQKIERIGKIILEFSNDEEQNETVTLRYEDYKINNAEIQGARTFTKEQGNFNIDRWTENFEELSIIDEFNSSTKISGEFVYNLTSSGDTLSTFTSMGSIEGRNITGRPLKMASTTQRQYSVDCISAGWVLPNSGIEVWEIFRNTNRSTAHTVSFSSEDNCESKARILLSDGRTIILEQ